MINISPAAINEGYFPSGDALIRPNGIIPILVENHLVGYQIKHGSHCYVETKRRMIKELSRYQLRVLKDNPHSDIHIVFEGDKYLRVVTVLAGAHPPIVNVVIQQKDVELITNKTGFPVIDQSEFYTL